MSRRQPSLSKKTSGVLESMMDEAGLTAVQRRQLRESASRGRSLPLDVPREGHSVPVVVRRRRMHYRPVEGKKIKQSIMRDAPPERDPFHPSGIDRGVDREKEKDVLAEMMETGKRRFDVTLKPKKTAKMGSEDDLDTRGLVAQDPETERFNELEEEVHERMEWLESMRRAKKLREYIAIISPQVSEKIVEMKQLDVSRFEAIDQEWQEFLKSFK
eukprot:TRINITY_DN366_c0_g1_i1.p1 TRINITY_DN366_c0_g1~~TRINITY_DN366_c0_g1_i1.p1  ORF type:complete len:215 (-),score=69.16 TRINITY_DN366_c0_g1_i1:52-696(-)